MRAFKKLMAGAIATAIAATMATSAFAAGFDAKTGKVSVDYTATEGQTTVLIVPAANWIEDVNSGNWSITSLDDEDILYIDQYENDEDANAAIVAGFGVKLDSTGTLAVGNYYALFGGNTEDGFAITPVAFEVKAAENPEEPAKILIGDVNNTGVVDLADLSNLSLYLLDMQEINNDYIDAADVNATGIVDLADLSDLSLYLLDLKTFEYEYTTDKPEGGHVVVTE